MLRIDLSISLDGGVTWSSKVPRTLNWLGQRQNILMWESMGVVNDLILKFEFWQLNRAVVSNGLLDIIL